MSARRASSNALIQACLVYPLFKYVTVNLTAEMVEMNKIVLVSFHCCRVWNVRKIGIMIALFV